MAPLPRPLERLFERADLPTFALPAGLAALYGGDIGFAATRLYANFVTSLDGVVTLDSDDESGHLISGDSQADLFVMGLLRACADAVLVGAGTFRKAPGARWHPESVYPSPWFAELRRQLGLRPQPLLVLLSASGELDPAAPALDDALIMTTPRGAARLHGRLPPGARLDVFAGDGVALPEVLERLRAAGLGRVLTEGGPTLIGQLIAARLLDELFVTSAPALYGRYPGDHRKSLVDGNDVARTGLTLVSARRYDSHLFLRYQLSR